MVLVEGELGAGKTTFVRGASRSLGVTVPVTSPTFTIGQRYPGAVRVAHVDLFRVVDLGAEDPELLSDYLAPDTITFVEWPSHGEEEVALARADRRADQDRAHRQRPSPGDDRAVRILAFDTATRATTVALELADGELLEARDDPAPGERPRHAATLLPLADELLDRAGLGFADLELIAVGIGPGTFTGLRIGIATARALAQALSIPIVGVSTLQSLALNARGTPGFDDGRRGARRPPRRGVRRRVANR